MKNSFQIPQVKVEPDNATKLPEPNIDSYRTTGINTSNTNEVVQSSDNECKTGAKEPFFKSRYLMVFFAFTVEFFYYYQRIVMTVSIVAMVNNTAFAQEEELEDSHSCQNLIQIHSHQGNSSAAYFHEREGEYLWSPEFQGYILGSSFLGQFLANPLAARFAEKFGAKKGLFCCLFFPSIFTFVTPMAAKWGVIAIIITQSLRGIAQAGTIPSQSVLIANWCPKLERGPSFAFVNSGSSIGGVLGSYITGVLCQSIHFGGWPSAFFVSGGAGFIVSLLLLFFSYDNPSVHPKISPAELHYIISNQEKALTEQRPATPWRSIFTSVPVYALGFAYYGQMWAASHFITANPTFLKTILHYSVKEDGVFSALPFLLQFFIVQIGAGLSILLNKKNYLSIDKTRKFWTLTSCCGYSVCLLGIYFSGCNRPIICVFSVLALAFTGFGFAGCWVVSTDMSPTFAASVNAISVPIGLSAHFTLPLIVGYLTNNSQTMEQWHKIFFISIAVVMTSGVTFAIFGSAEIQEWNYASEDITEMKASKFIPRKHSMVQTDD